MASLTHVCMWSDNGWKRITAEQAAKLHPGGTVSAHSGLFMCELCGQYVSLTDGAVQTRHFRHSAYEKSKNCPERILGAGYSISYGSQEHDLPIRITGVSAASFRFEIGLIRAPISSLTKDFCIEIKPKGVSTTPNVFTKERLNYEGITYLPIGERPFEKYTLNFKNGIDKLREFWPAEITGIDPEGTLFEKSSGKKLTYDADVEIEKEYYLLKRGYFYRRSYSSIRIQEIVQKQFGWESWTLYIVSASAFSEEAARFFLDFHCRLTEHPVSLQPVWPLFVEGNYIVKHSQDNMYILRGNQETADEWKTRLVYSICGMMAYASLWDDTEESISIVHLRRRIRSILGSYKSLYPELLGTLPQNSEELEEEITNQFLSAGVVYHRPNRIVASKKHEEHFGGVLFQRGIVVDKQTYQIGGFYYPGSERRHGQSLTPARAYTEDPNYVKEIISCPECGWFGLREEKTKRCPFCGNSDLKITREMMRPWGFAPRNAESIPDVQLSEEYTAVQQPLYSTLPEAEEMKLAPGCKNIRIASRTNQRIIMLNKGTDDKGFMVCKDCGAAMPGDDISVLNDINRPYKSKYTRGKCRHSNYFNVNLGYDFITDMLVLEFTIDDRIIDVRRNDNPWLNRAAQSLAEALRLVASKKLDVEFTELVTGYRLRTGPEASYVDIYLYDSLSSGAGYAVSVADAIAELLADMKELLSSCNCGSACSKCLKHYRNQYVHGMLDRFAALQLLEWGVDGINALPIKPETQIEMIMPLVNILKQSGCEITSDGEIIATGRRNTKRVVVYPAMWVEPQATGTIFVSDAYIKYAKPYAVQKILDSIQ